MLIAVEDSASCPTLWAEMSKHEPLDGSDLISAPYFAGSGCLAETHVPDALNVTESFVWTPALFLLISLATI